MTFHLARKLDEFKRSSNVLSGRFLRFFPSVSFLFFPPPPLFLVFPASKTANMHEDRGKASPDYSGSRPVSGALRDSRTLASNTFRFFRNRVTSRSFDVHDTASNGIMRIPVQYNTCFYQILPLPAMIG